MLNWIAKFKKTIIKLNTESKRMLAKLSRTCTSNIHVCYLCLQIPCHCENETEYYTLSKCMSHVIVIITGNQTDVFMISFYKSIYIDFMANIVY